METWATVLIAGLAIVPPTIVAWASLQQSKRNAKQGEKTAATLDEVHILTNSNLAAIKAELAASAEKVKDLEAIISKLVDARDGAT